MPEGLQLRSTVTEDGAVELSLATVTTPPPGADEVVIRVDAAPINPSDLGLLFGPADAAAATATGSGTDAVLRAPIPEGLRRTVQARVGQALPAGNEGAGVVVEAGASDAAQALLGKTVAVIGGAMYAQYRVMKADQCLVMHEGVTAVEGASCFVNPLTALGMVETMRLEGHTALVHTAAASNLGQMLQKICTADAVPLVNIVRRDAHVDLLNGIGATHVLNSTRDGFMAVLTDALVATGATLGFDATGGGALAGQILTCMEAALVRSGAGVGRYGSSTHKQVYIYGGLDRSPTTLNRNFGMAWGLGGWLLGPFLERVGPAAAQKLRQRVADEIRTTFASHYTKEISLAEALSPEAVAGYEPKTTGEKYLIRPNQGL